MRKFILVAALVLVSATAQAATRSLTLASNDEPAAVTEQPKAVEAPKAVETPKYVERPAAVGTTTEAPKVDQAQPQPVAKADKPRRRGQSTEARVIYELHRHGIYW